MLTPDARDQVTILEQEIMLLKQEIRNSQELLSHIVLDLAKMTELYPYDVCPVCKQKWYIGHVPRDEEE